MEIRRMNAARGWIWIKHGTQLIMRNPLMSITFALISALILIGAFEVPLFGPLLLVMLLPVVMAGYMRLCRALEEEEEIELTHLFAGFQRHTVRLTALGGLLLVGLLLSSMAMVVIGGEPLRQLLENMNSANEPQLLIDTMWTAGSSIALSLLVGFVLMCALMLAFQYAPMLVFFNDIMPFEAMRASLAGSMRNIIPYTVYNLIMQIIALALSLLPFGIGLIVLLPLGLTSLYVSYRNIFPFAHELGINEPAAPGTEE